MAQNNGTKKKTMASLNNKVSALWNQLNRNPVLYLCLSAFLFVGGFFAEKALSAYLWADPAAAKVESLQSDIAKKTGSIEETLNNMNQSIEQLEIKGDGAKEFLESARTLKSKLEMLRPKLSTFSQQAARLSSELLRAKQSEISESGKSEIADFTLSVGSGITLCREEFTVGYHRWESNDTAELNISGGGKDTQYDLAPGQAARVEVGKSAVNVSLIGSQNDGEQIRMNFKCESKAT